MAPLTTTTAEPRLAAGSTALRRLQAAMAVAGLAAFSMLYSTQALLPGIGAAFGVSALAASLCVTLTPALVGLCVVPMSDLAERLGRIRVMTAGLAVACAGVAAGALCRNFLALLATRVAVGIALASVVAVAVGHIGDEAEPTAAGRAIGLYVAGTTLGGLAGRVVPAAVETVGGWRWSLAALAVLGAVCTVTFACLVPPGRAPSARAVRGWAAVRGHLRDRGIVLLCLSALLFMGGFVAIYNYLTYRLTAAPFRLPSGLVGLVFLVYLAGTAASVAAGAASVRVGRTRVLLISVACSLAGLALTLPDSLVLIIAGLIVFTAGFFGCHTVASAWVSVRARGAKAQASALYLLSYYTGAGVVGTGLGLAWQHGRWTATVIAVACCYAGAGLCILGIRDRR